MTNTPARIGIVGVGMISVGSHLPACLASTQVEIAALVDPVIDRARDAASTFGIAPRLSTRIEDVLHDVDGVIIATPNGTHCDIALTCLAAGIDVLIDKPLAATVDEGERIVAAARQYGRVAAVGYCTRFRNNLQLLKRLLEERYFGDVKRFVHQFGTPGGWAPFSAYNLNRQSAGGGVLVVTASHFIDRLIWLWGMPDRVVFADDSLGGPEANCVADFFWGSDTRVVLHGAGRYSKTIALPSGLVLETEAGIVKVADSDDAEILLSPRDRLGLEMVVRHRSGAERFPTAKSVFQLQVEDFVFACRTRRKPMVDAMDGLESQKLFERLYATRSAMSEHWYPNTAIERATA